MKKVISILLAVLMMFSFVTVAFAEGTDATDTTEAPEAGTESVIPDLGEYDWLLDLPFWTVGPALKFAKIAFKLVSVYLKVAKIFGLVEEDMDDIVLNLIADMIANAQQGEQVEEDTTAAGTLNPAA